MRALLQRVSRGRVLVEGQVVGEIGPGLCVFLGAGQGDTASPGERLLEKILALRIFEDAAGKMNLSLCDCQGSLLVVSQFTLYADVQKGNRPGFSQALSGPMAKDLYDSFLERARQRLGAQKVAAGIFGANMQVEITNDGPVTIWLDFPPDP